ncbi:hypothetical protein V8C86DRAFT_2697525 [Haematococcus lacustris]
MGWTDPIGAGVGLSARDTAGQPGHATGRTHPSAADPEPGEVHSGDLGCWLSLARLHQARVVEALQAQQTSRTASLEALRQLISQLGQGVVAEDLVDRLPAGLRDSPVLQSALRASPSTTPMHQGLQLSLDRARQLLQKVLTLPQGETRDAMLLRYQTRERDMQELMARSAARQAAKLLAAELQRMEVEHEQAEGLLAHARMQGQYLAVPIT